MEYKINMISSIYYGIGVITLIFLQLSLMNRNKIYVYFLIGSQIIFILIDIIFIGNIEHLLSKIEHLYNQVIRFILGLFRYDYDYGMGYNPEPESGKSTHPKNPTTFRMDSVEPQDEEPKNVPDILDILDNGQPPTQSIKQFLADCERIYEIEIKIKDHKTYPSILKRQKEFKDKGGDMTDLKSLRFQIDQGIPYQWSLYPKQMNKQYVETMETRVYQPNILKLLQAYHVRVSEAPIAKDGMLRKIIEDCLPPHQASQSEQIELIVKYFSK